MLFSKIYRKLYVWFLLIFILTIFVVSTLVHGFYLERVRDELEGQLESHARFLLSDYQSACGDSTNRQSKTCQDFLARINRIRPLDFWIVDRSGHVLLSNEHHGPPPFDRRELERAAAGERVVSVRRRGPPRVIVPIRDDRGTIEELAVVQRGFPGERFPRFPVFASFLIVVLTIAVLILPLSKRLTKPVSELHKLGQEWAEGHLERRAKVSGNDEISDLARTFNEMAEKLQNMMQRRKEFFASISHELKSPLTRMRIALELLSEKTREADAEELIQSLQNEIQESEGLIEQLLVLSRLEMSLAPAHEVIHLEKIVERALEQTKSFADYRKIELRHSGHVDISGDAVQLERAIVNIIENAIKFSEPGQTVDVQLRRQNGNAILMCKDQGKGIRPEEAQKIFEPFYRGATSAEKSGSGLGLFIAKRIIEKHSGTIHAEPNQPRGTTITITLPAV
jgi:signal transduction histidine kinase